MAKVARRTSAPVSPPALVIGLADPGMTHLLRAGLGGLAASLRAIAVQLNPSASWRGEVELGVGTARVEADSVTLSWGKSTPEDVLRALFESSFDLDPTYGMVLLPGAYSDAVRAKPEVVAALQAALRGTFLNHNKFVTLRGVAAETSTPKGASPEEKKARKTAKDNARRAALGTYSFEVDEKRVTITMQGLTGYVNRGYHGEIAAAVRAGTTIQLPSWAYPGATQRHIKFNETKLEYSAAQALCASFAIVGCVVLATRSGGVVVIPEPADLRAFAEIRPLLTPERLEDVFVTGVGDSVLAVEASLRMDRVERHRNAVRVTHGVALGRVPWDPQRRVRVATIPGEALSDTTLDLYDAVTRTLPTVLIAGKDGDYYPAQSEFRRFVTENIAQRRPWHEGFAAATDGNDKKPRFIHYYRSPDRKNLGALRPREREGLIAMNEHLDEAQAALVNSVHVAIRQRFGAIREETEGNPVARKKRWENERERWRLAFAGAKTSDQVRRALADLWSRAGSNKVLRDHWQSVIPLLDPEHWQLARDLALVALASYKSDRGDPMSEDDEAQDDETDET